MFKSADPKTIDPKTIDPKTAHTKTLQQLIDVFQLNIFKMTFVSPFTKNIISIGTNHLFNMRILTKFVSNN